MGKIKRNTLAVRLEDVDYDAFMKNTGRNYSGVLRELIIAYNQGSTSDDHGLSGFERVRRSLKRLNSDN